MAVFAILNSIVGEDFNEKLTVEKSLEGCDGVNHVGMWGENIPGGGPCTCKGPEALGELWLLQSAMGIHKRV